VLSRLTAMHKPTQTALAPEPKPNAGDRRAVCGRLHALVGPRLVLHAEEDGMEEWRCPRCGRTLLVDHDDVAAHGPLVCSRYQCAW